SRLDRAEAAARAGRDDQAATLLSEVVALSASTRLGDPVMARLSALDAELERRAGARAAISEQRELLARVDAEVASGDFEQAAALLAGCFTARRTPEALRLWEDNCRAEAVAACEKFASARLLEARIAQKAGFRAAVAPLAAAVSKVLAVLPESPELKAELARLTAPAAPSQPVQPKSPPVGIPPAPRSFSYDATIVAPQPVVQRPAASAVRPTPCDRLTLEYRRGELEKRRLHILSARSVTFGRSSAADVLVRVLSTTGDAERVNRMIGRRHFTIENGSTFITLVDGARGDNGTVEASKNGVFVDGRKILYPRSIEGRGEMLHAASQQMATDVAHWSLRKIQGDAIGASVPASLCPGGDGRWPLVSGLFMARQDEMPEDVLLVWGAAPLGIVDQSLAQFWVVRSGDGFLIWDGYAPSDAAQSSESLRLLSAGRLSHIGA
ncbi:MAG TPA: FHA domain-containing protein, partial [Opitutales bacterium]|nr:FHA domain-containing protein [Opitutales bacterium]